MSVNITHFLCFEQSNGQRAWVPLTSNNLNYGYVQTSGGSYVNAHGEVWSAVVAGSFRINDLVQTQAWMNGQ